MKRQQGMRRRREAELTILLQALPLAEQVQAQAAGVPLGLHESLSSCQRETKTRHALDAFIGGRDQVVDSPLRQVYRHCPKAAHRVYKVARAGLLHHSSDFFHRIHQPGRRFAMDYRDIRDRGIGFEGFFNLRKVRHLVLREFKRGGTDVVDLRNLSDAPPVGPIDDNQHLAV